MIEVLDSLKYKKQQDLTTINVSVNDGNLPTYSQQIVNGRYVYSNSFIPQFLEGTTNYTVSSQSTNQSLIRDYVNLKTSYDVIDYQVDYLKNTVYKSLSSLDISNFIYWYDVANIYSLKTVTSQVSTLTLFNTFSDLVGSISLFTPTTDSIVATSVYTTDIKPYNRTIESLINDDIRSTIDQAYKDVNSSYSANTVNIALGTSPDTSHGERLVVDSLNNTRYTSSSSVFIGLLYTLYGQLMYLTPSFATKLQQTQLPTEPFFTSTIENSAIVVDKFGNKVSIDSGWTEQIMFSAYSEE